MTTAFSKVDWQKYLLLAAMAVAILMLISKWGEFQERHRPAVNTQTTLGATTTPSPSAPSIPDGEPATAASDSDIPRGPDLPVEVETAAAQQLIHIQTDSLDVLIDTKGGDIVKVGLPRHYAQIDTPDVPFTLLNRNDDHIYVAQSGLVGKNGTDSSGARPVYAVEQSSYNLNDGEDSLSVDLTLQQGEVTITKRFTFHRSDYLIEVEYLIDNRSSSDWKANFYAQIKRDSMLPPVDGGAIGVQPFVGAAITTPEENYKKLDFSDLEEKSFKTDINGGWVAMVQHYFLSAWVADTNTENNFHLRKVRGKDLYLVGYVNNTATEVAAGSQGSVKAGFYAGPKDVYRLEELAPYLDLTVDYGWLWWIAKPLFQVLNFIYGFLGSWGWSIIALTIMIKAVFFQLSATSYRSMANMRKLQPKVTDLRDRYGDDRQKMSQEMMKLYKEEKVNPLGGCLPILVQMPVFIALYWVLLESVELRHTPFLGWIEDLSVKDPLFILPLIMGATMWVQQKLNPTPPDPTQARIMQMMPIVFTFMFMWFPAGLVLYWVVNNSLSIVQQYIITKQIEAAD